MLIKCPNCGAHIRIVDLIKQDHLKYFCQECEQIVSLDLPSDEIQTSSSSGSGHKYQQHIPRILVADDTVSFAKIVKDLLYREGYSVSLAYDGVEALKKIVEERPNAMVLDLFMPKMTGFEVLQALRTNAGYKNFRTLPVLVTSGVYKAAEVEIAHELGASGFIPKDAVLDQLVYRMRKLLGPVEKRSGSTDSVDFITR